MLQASCGARRKRRDVSGYEEKITVHLFKEIVMYPKNETEESKP